MAAKNWWFKFDYRIWKTDSNLRRCSLETRGFWLELLCSMYESDEYEITGSYEELGRLAGCDASVVAKCVTELSRTKTADVTLGHGIVTVMSRRLQTALKAKKDSTLRKRKQRERKPVTQESHDRVISKSKNKEKEEEEEGISAEMQPAPITVPDLKNHPVILTLREVTGLYPPKEIWDSLIDLLAHDLDAARMKQCFTKWRARGYNKLNYDWVTDWYVNGIPKQGKGETNGNYRQQREQQAIDENAVIVGIRAKRNAERAAEQLQRGDLADSSRQLRGIVTESDLAGEVSSGRSLGPPALSLDPRIPLAGSV